MFQHYNVPVQKASSMKIRFLIFTLSVVVCLLNMWELNISDFMDLQKNDKILYLLMLKKTSFTFVLIENETTFLPPTKQHCMMFEKAM